MVLLICLMISLFSFWLLFFIDSATKSQTSNYKSPVKMNVHMHSQLIERLSALPRWLLCTYCHESCFLEKDYIEIWFVSITFLSKVTGPFKKAPYYPRSHFTFFFF